MRLEALASFCGVLFGSFFGVLFGFRVSGGGFWLVLGRGFKLRA